MINILIDMEELTLENGFRIIIFSDERAMLSYSGDQECILDISTNTGFTTGFPINILLGVSKKNRGMYLPMSDNVTDDEAIKHTMDHICRILTLCIIGKHQKELVERLDLSILRAPQITSLKGINEYTVEIVTDKIINGQKQGVDIWYQKKVKRKKSKFDYNKKG